MKTARFILMLLILGCFSVGIVSAGQVDTFTSASVSYYYPPAASFDELAQLTFNGVVVVSTTNPDGSPNAAVIIPSIFEDKYVIMRMAPNQTLLNLQRDGRAVITAFVPNPEKKDEEVTYASVRRYGARISIVVMEENQVYEGVIERWNKTVQDERYKLAPGIPVFQITAVHPVG